MEEVVYTQSYKVARLKDRQIHDGLSALVNEHRYVGIKANVLGEDIGRIDFPLTKGSAWDKIIELDSELINQVDGEVDAVRFIYYRGGSGSERSPFFDEVKIEIRYFTSDCYGVVAKIYAAFSPVPLPKFSDKNGLLEAQNAVQQSTFARLQQLQEDMAKNTVELWRQLDERTAKRESELENKLAERQAKIDEELKAEQQALIKKNEELEERRRIIDDSDNTHARRQIRERMLADVQQRMQQFGVSSNTSAKRRPVFFGMMLLMGFLSLLLLWTAYELTFSQREQLNAIAAAAISDELRVYAAAFPAVSAASAAKTSSEEAFKPAPVTAWISMPTERIALWARLSILSFGLAASLIFYIRWQNNWAEQHAQSEFSLQQFHVDINRANWVIETCLEWSKEAKSPIPDTLLESISRGLFIGKEPREQVLHPADELASALLGSSSKLTLNVGDSRMEIDKPSKIPKKIIQQST